MDRVARAAVHEEEIELGEAIRPRRGTGRDALAAAAALGLVLGASVLMEQAATTVGARLGAAGIVTGALVLAVVTSLPNAVAAVYLAARGRGAAVLSTALTSNALNVTVGLLLPGALLGLGPRSGTGILVAGGELDRVLQLGGRCRGRGPRCRSGTRRRSRCRTRPCSSPRWFASAAADPTGTEAAEWSW